LGARPAMAATPPTPTRRCRPGAGGRSYLSGDGGVKCRPGWWRAGGRGRDRSSGSCARGHPGLLGSSFRGWLRAARRGLMG
jgi:hypothetical protein